VILAWLGCDGGQFWFSHRLFPNFSLSRLLTFNPFDLFF